MADLSPQKLEVYGYVLGEKQENGDWLAAQSESWPCCVTL